MPRASAADAARTAQQVLDSATELFAERGYSAVLLDDVAHVAGVTRGAVYHHYRNKPGLFLAVAERLQHDVGDQVVAAAEASGDDPAEQLRSGSHAFLDAITEGLAARILLVEAPAVVGWEQWRQLDAQNSAQHLREALEALGVPSELTDAFTAQLSGAMNEAALWVAQHRDRTAARRLAHEALDRLLSAVI